MRTNGLNSPDKGTDTLITSILHEELSILQKKAVPLLFERQTEEDALRPL